MVFKNQIQYNEVCGVFGNKMSNRPTQCGRNSRKEKEEIKSKITTFLFFNLTKAPILNRLK